MRLAHNQGNRGYETRNRPALKLTRTGYDAGLPCLSEKGPDRMITAETFDGRVKAASR
ncbi:MAG: hypothetical protein JWN13_6408 [Betaproteobacteria bacterium]|jgi:hypothetical protein|nr:hypothetical protein [Betaproteobacteria bacterium]